MVGGVKSGTMVINTKVLKEILTYMCDPVL